MSEYKVNGLRALRVMVGITMLILIMTGGSGAVTLTTDYENVSVISS